jgi:hypothetical protein
MKNDLDLGEGGVAVDKVRDRCGREPIVTGQWW